MRVVVAHLLRDPVAPHRQPEPLHDVVGVAGASDRVAVCAADGFGPLQCFRVVAEEVVLGALGEGSEEVGFGGEDADDGRVEVVVANCGFDRWRVEATGAVDQGFFPESLAAEAEGKVKPWRCVAGDRAVEDLAEGEEGGFDGAGDDGGLGGGSVLWKRRSEGIGAVLLTLLRYSATARTAPADSRRNSRPSCSLSLMSMLRL